MFKDALTVIAGDTTKGNAKDSRWLLVSAEAAVLFQGNGWEIDAGWFACLLEIQPTPWRILRYGLSLSRLHYLQTFQLLLAYQFP